MLSSANEVVADPACNTCHDNLYYNYDLGKAYCVDSARTRCVDCHDGDPTSLDKNVAHGNMVAFPVIEGDDTRCQGCHQEDSSARVGRFAKIAGFRSQTYVPETPYNFSAQAAANASSALAGEEGLTWQVKILLSLGAVLAFFGFVFISRFFHQ
jgi:hypothetical protein